MTTIVTGPAIRLIAVGTQVSRAAANLPATAAQNIFSVTGGRILLTSLVAQVTTVIQNQACTAKITNTPAAGTATDIASATSIIAKEVGTLISMPVTKGGALVVGANAGDGLLIGELSALLLQPGTISYTTSATNTGALSWALTYVVYDTGATVAAL